MTASPPDPRNLPREHAPGRLIPRQESEARGRGRLAAAAAACGLAFIALTALVSGTTAPGWELDLVEAATDAPDAIGYPARGVMELGTLPMVVVVSVGAWLVLQRWRPAVALAGTALVAWLVAGRAKDVAERARPVGVRLRDDTGGFGYPSGHTAVAFALATVAAPLFPSRWRWLPYAAAAVVGLARMHVGVHYPVDVVGGALVGIGLGLAARSIVRYAAS
ncbi:MAG: phosphatase PAP2 family protein [Acidimicrobiales bacterium]